MKMEPEKEQGNFKLEKNILKFILQQKVLRAFI